MAIFMTDAFFGGGIGLHRSQFGRGFWSPKIVAQARSRREALGYTGSSFVGDFGILKSSLRLVAGTRGWATQVAVC